ncbi:MAG: DUF4351 domain-containing protein [Magnetococcales bacterium]|nr:DUF4351 domain-containing protein [Magnetococcales bacterium]
MSSIQAFTEEAFPGDSKQYASRFAKEMIAKGRQEGRQEGEQKGEVKLLLRLLGRRFGALPNWIVEKVTVADQSVLELWGDRVLDAQSLDDVFMGEG